MHRGTKTSIALAIVALFAAPSTAGATWYFAQSFEPSSDHYDTSAWMWNDAPEANETRVYFASFAQYSFIVASANPNVGLLHTQIEVSNSEFHTAVLGVWKDCNGDGYIGMAESALREYPAHLLSTLAVCPLEEGPAAGWTAGAHNYNGWVSELIPIGRDPTLTIDRRIYEDDDVRVWGDYHRPDEAPWHRPCPLAPQPRGTYQSTGGMMNFVDCRVDILGVGNIALDLIGDPAGWYFSDPENAHSSPLGRINTFGDENDANRAVTVWDCSSGTRLGDEINESGAPADVTRRLPNAVHNFVLYEPDPEVEDTSTPNERIAATVNHTAEGLDDCDTMGEGDDGGDVYEGICVVYCVGEGDFNGIDPEDKREAHFNMRFNMGARGTLPWNPAGVTLRWNGAGGPPSDPAGWGGSTWTGTTFWLTKPGFSTIRTHLQEPTNSTVEIAPGLWFTWYAYLGEDTLERGYALPGGGTTGTYADWHCGSATSGAPRGFNCDASKWYINPDGTPVDPQDLQPNAELEAHELVRPGQKYHLRDVDCYDGGLGDTGVGIQPAYYGAGACY